MGPGPVDREREFRERYAMSGAPVVLATEREALGTDYQANGYTTIAEARMIGDLLELARDEVLLDLGSGCGWPGLLLAGEHGCRVVTTDPAHEGNITSVARAVRDGLASRHMAVTARGWELPFPSAAFDAIVHTDVLC